MKYQRLFSLCFIVLFSVLISISEAQEDDCDTSVRSLDGSCNNIENPTWGQVGSLLKAPFGFRPSNFTLPAARDITNKFFSERAFKHSGLYNKTERLSGLSPNTENLNILITGFHQLIGHDLSMAKLKSCFGPGCFVNSPITDPTDFLYMTTDEIPGLPTNRTMLFIPGGNLTIVGGNPYHTNDASAYLDGATFYGSTQTTLDGLRTKTDGKMIMRYDVGDTTFGELPNSKLTNTPNQCSAFGDFGLASGDPRTETNSALAAFHTLFIREHNRLATLFKALHPTWNDEQLFQEARKFVIAIYQHITVTEFLPTQFGIEQVLLELGLYTGYKPNVDVSLSNAFSVSANRLTHDQVNLPMLVLHANESVALLPGTEGWPDIERINCVADKYWEFGTDAIFRGGLQQKAQVFDAKHVDDIRSFPAKLSTALPYNFDVKGMDLEREREAKIPSYYHVRLSLTGEDIYEMNGCTAGTIDSIGCFLHITTNLTAATDLQSVYKKVSNVELHVGLLVDSDKTSTGFPRLGAKIWLRQIKAARDGDRFWYKNYLHNGLFNTVEFLLISTTSLSSLIKRNTGLDAPEVPLQAFKLKGAPWF